MAAAAIGFDLVESRPRFEVHRLLRGPGGGRKNCYRNGCENRAHASFLKLPQVSVPALHPVLVSIPTVAKPKSARTLQREVGSYKLWRKWWIAERAHALSYGSGGGGGGVRVGLRERCRTVSTTVQRDDGRTRARSASATDN